VDVNGEKWITVKQLAEALGYVDRQQLLNPINRNRLEFHGKTFQLKLSGNVGRPETVINYHGCIRAAMLSDAPRAREFRDWAEMILFAVMTGAAETVSTQLLSEMADMRQWREEMTRERGK
jgi:prophage antirepressor-like protein